MMNIEKLTLMTLFAQTNDGYNDNQYASVFLHSSSKDVLVTHKMLFNRTCSQWPLSSLRGQFIVSTLPD